MGRSKLLLCKEKFTQPQTFRAASPFDVEKILGWYGSCKKPCFWKKNPKLVRVLIFCWNFSRYLFFTGNIQKCHKIWYIRSGGGAFNRHSPVYGQFSDLSSWHFYHYLQDNMDGWGLNFIKSTKKSIVWVFAHDTLPITSSAHQYLEIPFMKD